MEPVQANPSTDGASNEDKNPWIRFSIEYRHRDTGNLIHREVTERFANESQDTVSINMPVFEVLTIYTTKPIESEDSKKTPSLLPTLMTARSYKLRIYSPAIINALQSVVQYYPAQELAGEAIVVQWPYAVLVHHYDELSDFRDACATKDPRKVCIRERNTREHLTLLLHFLDEHVMTDVRAERERNKRGFYTWEHAWVHLKPGATFLQRFRTESDWTPYVVHSISGGVFDNPPKDWTCSVWKLVYDGKYLGRHMGQNDIVKFDGELDFTKCDKRLVEVDALEESARLDQVVAQQIEYGKKYWKLLKKQCKYYKGKSRDFPFNEIDGLVMTDPKSHYTHSQPPRLMDDTDCRNWVTDCVCATCRERKADSSEKQITSLFGDYNYIDVEDEDELTAHQYLVCNFEMHAYVFSTRKWERLHVDNFFEPKFEENMFDNLVMEEQRKRILKGLSKSFARRNKNDEIVPMDLWEADFVKGKGGGLIFLLHGKPGVGKTCTAECVAAFTRRPLMVLTPSDIGTDPDDVESILARNFKTAQSWGAVILIDEADVFMECRSTTDLVRNSFLRALEYYSGILFLTTNRVGAFDDAFVSRVHIQLHYDEFTDSQRQQVWHTFIDKLARERGSHMRLNIDAKEYIRGAEMRSVKWNGREIRNAFQTAVALAEYDDEKDEDGKIILSDTHFRAVLELSKDFKDYLNDLHKGNEGKRAQRKYERLDTYNTKSE
ncbi:ATPase (AAA) domain protein [Metarhizium robertsii]|uniref:ATPase n=2 Tax=Metarhizium robertsii TaxID=568076 RepID=E9F7R5_METRA|nr:ATPase [Metarhizium robertsii ARSEF 23]EFY96203.2 ATPase [Metarhizium robertsii ARSEF 23]EXU98463.1 ATPase (AAA) domain protein [Metarhizium robertsii]